MLTSLEVKVCLPPSIADRIRPESLHQRTRRDAFTFVATLLLYPIECLQRI